MFMAIIKHIHAYFLHTGILYIFLFSDLNIGETTPKQPFGAFLMFLFVFTYPFKIQPMLTK